MNNPKTFWQTTFVFTFLANLVILAWSVVRWAEIGVILYRSVWGIALLLYLAVLAGCVFVLFWIRSKDVRVERLVALLELQRLTHPVWRALGGGLFLGILFLIPWLKFTLRVGEVVKQSTQDPVLTTILFYWVCWWLVLLASVALKVALRSTWQGGFAAAVVILGVAYEIFLQFRAVSGYPFSLGWSETSRYFYASLYFSEWLYGERFALSTLHPTRYFLQSLAYLVPWWGLTEHRFWQFLLWVVMTGVVAVSLAWRTLRASTQQISPPQTGTAALFAGWFFLYLLLVGVYYHLAVMVFVPLWFVSSRHPWRSLVAIIFASLWAGVSRVNWFPMPAMVATAIYLLEVPFRQFEPQERENITRPKRVLSALVAYFSLPVLWTVGGLLSALIAQAAYIPLSGNADNPEIFASSFTSDLLWYRLWPNALFPLGIVPAILIVTGPCLLIVLTAMRQHRQLHFVRWLGLWAMIAVLFGGSLVVSVKIGGGGDLHNMDTYAVLIGIVAAYFLGNKVAGEQEWPAWRLPVAWPVVAVACMTPLLFLLPSLSPRLKYNQPWAAENLRQLKTLVETANGPVLFITERHLVTFGDINVSMIPEYERVTLMEAAMSNNRKMLEAFYADLRAHRFALIVSGKENLFVKEDEPFAEENNVWNTRVSPYLLCYYEPVALFEPEFSRIEVFARRAIPASCP
ncbi:MAG: hypothetical protein DDG60_07245 [Anaerolineae bacterium]|nr:MAG: hypothetical protein DDG60_07245 [Anaerolineae bacterium]